MNKETLWVLTQTYNLYDQQGDYLVTVFLTKPNQETLLQLMYGKPSKNTGYSKTELEFIEHLLNGGGRIGLEESWYYLSILGEGEEYEHSI